MSRSTDEEIETSDWVTSWTQRDEASNASQFDSPSSSSGYAHIPNVEAVAVNVFLFEPSCFRVRHLLHRSYVVHELNFG